MTRCAVDWSITKQQNENEDKGKSAHEDIYVTVFKNDDHGWGSDCSLVLELPATDIH